MVMTDNGAVFGSGKMSKMSIPIVDGDETRLSLQTADEREN